METDVKLFVLILCSIINVVYCGGDAVMGPVRLRHLEHSSFRGQAQVNVDGQWGVMCDRDYTDQEAQVVCRELQCEGGRRGKGIVQTSEPQTMHSFQCTGGEARLQDCSYAGANLPGCQHNGLDTICIPVTGTPRSVQITNLSHASLRVSWSPPTNGTCQRVLGYKVQCTGGNKTHSLNYNPTGTNKEGAEVTGLTPSTAYQCCVTAYNAEGSREQTSCSPTKITLPDSPQNISTQVSAHSVLVTWGPPPGDEKVISYSVTLYRNMELQQQHSTEEPSKMITRLKSNTQYELRLSARTSLGQGPLSEPVFFRTQIYATEAGVFAFMTFSIVVLFIPTLIICIAVISCYRVRPCYCCWKEELVAISWEDCETAPRWTKNADKQKQEHSSAYHCKEGSDETMEHRPFESKQLLHSSDQSLRLQEASVTDQQIMYPKEHSQHNTVEGDGEKGTLDQLPDDQTEIVIENVHTSDRPTEHNERPLSVCLNIEGTVLPQNIDGGEGHSSPTTLSIPKHCQHTTKSAELEEVVNTEQCSTHVSEHKYQDARVESCFEGNRGCETDVYAKSQCRQQQDCCFQELELQIVQG